MALHLVLTFSADEANDATYLLWGQTAQAEYGTLMNECLEMSQSPELQHAVTHLTRLQEILEGIDLEKLKEVGQGLMAKFLGTSREKVLEVFTSTQSELTHLMKLLQDAIPSLLDLKKRLSDTKERVKELSSKLQAESLAAEFVVGYMRKSGMSDKAKMHAQILEGRSMALTGTVAQITGSNSMFEIQINQPLNVITCVQDTVLTKVPAWLGNYMALKLLFERKSKPTETQLTELGHKLSEILSTIRKS
jgi:hypothetical protein